jgi:hypothetical protein
MATPDQVTDKLLRLRYPATCSICRSGLQPGTQGWWNSTTRSATCTACHPTTPVAVSSVSDSVPPLGLTDQAGASVRLIYEQKRGLRNTRIEQQWGPLSGVVKFFSDEPQSTKAWAKGAEGERKLAAHLRRTVGDRVVVLHDRRIPGSRANIDHLIVAASGVWIVDAKSYKGKVEQRDLGKWLKSDNRLYVNGRDQSKLADGLFKQITAVLQALDGLDSDVDFMAALCFVDSEWGLFAKPFLQGGVLVTWPKMLSKAIVESGPLSRDEMVAVAEALAGRLPAAVPVG